MKRLRIPAIVLAVTVVAALPGALTSCGGGDDSKSQAQKRAAAARAKAARERARREQALRRRRARARRLAGGCPAGLVPQGTEACVRPGGGAAGCGGNPYSTPTRQGGCIGPAHPPSNGPAASCPPGQVPAGQTGACAPAQPPAQRSPSVDSPEGQRELRNDPDCQGKPPPPPSYHGPVQC